MRRPFFFLVAALLPLLLYARTTTYGFVHADDADLIAANQPFLRDPRNVLEAFARSYFDVEGELTSQKTYYRPVAIVSFMLDATRAGADPRAYHLTNVALHAAATCLLLALALAWGAAPWAAFVAALVFAVHPVNVQAVAWIAGRNDLLLAAFGMTSLMAWHALGVGSWRLGIVAAHAATFALALFSKETGLLVPVLALLHQRIVARASLTRAQWMALAVDALVVAAWAALRAAALGGQPPELTVQSLQVGIGNLPQLLLHAGKMLAPIDLNVAPGVNTAGLLLGAAAVLLFARLVPGRLAAFGAVWVLAFLVPTLVVPGLPAYEHRAYLPLAGIALAGAQITKRQSDRRTERQGDTPTQRPGPSRVWALSVCALWLCAFAALTWQRQPVFRDAFAYWTDAVRDPQFGPMANVNLGQLYEAEGRMAEARREYLRALERNPNTPKAHNDLGVVLMKLDEPDLALTHFREETRRHPWNADAWFNLGLFEETRGDAAAARRNYQRAIEANPAYVPAYEKLGLTSPGPR